MRELDAISSELKAELRWGQRRGLLPNTAWTKNQHLVSGEIRTLVESAYAQAHWLDENTLAAQQPQLDKEETQAREQAKKAVDDAAAGVRQLRNEMEP